MRFSIGMSSLAAFAAITMQTIAAATAVAQAPGVTDTSLVARGQIVFESVCSTCHTVQPPAKLAPPMTHVLRHYRAELSDSAATVARIIAWIAEPSAERSLMPAHARERFGLMPPVSLTDDQRRAVASYVWSLGGGDQPMQHGDSTHTMPPGDGARAMQHGRGEGGMRHGAGPGPMRRGAKHGPPTSPPDTSLHR